MSKNYKAVTEPTRSEYKGHPMLKLPLNGGTRDFSFGLAKAKAILKYIEAIEEFVADNSD